jgi:single-strand DNA-binding protein
MSYSINHVVLVGNVARDPSIKFTSSGMAICNFSLATNRSIKKNDAWEKIPTFHNIVVWGKLAEQLGEKLHKGQLATVVGRIDNRSYEDKQGVKKYISEVVADSVIFDSRGSSQPAPQPAAQPTEDPADAFPPDDFGDDDTSSDVPF